MNDDTLSTLPVALIRLPDVERMTCRKKSSIYFYMKQGFFPKSVKLGSAPNSAVAWRLPEVSAWVESRVHYDAPLD